MGVIGSTFLFKSYCAEYVKSTQSGLEVAYEMGKVLNMVSYDQGATGTEERRTKSVPRMARLQTHRQRARMSYYNVNLSHVE